MARNIDPVNYELIQQILGQAHQIPFENVFSPTVNAVLHNETLRAATTVQFVLPSLLTATACFMGKAHVRVLNEHVVPIIYSGLCAQPSTGKSAAMRFTTSAIEKVERFLNIPTTKSCQVNAPTIEGFLEILKDNPEIAAFHDEGACFFEAMGRYNNGNGKYELGVYDYLWNGVDFLGIDLKSKGRVRIMEPLPQINMGIHPWTIISLFLGLRRGHDDGIMHRFQIMCPIVKKWKTELVATAGLSDVSIVALLFFIRVIHDFQPRTYTLTAEAAKILRTKIDDYNELTDTFNTFDFFLGSMTGKAACILQRNCLFLKALHMGVEILAKLPIALTQQLTPGLVHFCNRFAENPPPNMFVIDLEMTDYARNLTNVMLKHKLVLASYIIDPLATPEEIFNHIIQERRKVPVIAGVFLKFNKEIVNFMRKIMLHQSSEVLAKDITNGNAHVDGVISAMEALQEHGFGKVNREKNKLNHKVVAKFERIGYQELATSTVLTAKVQDLGLGLNQVLELFLITQKREANHEVDLKRKKNKRKRNNQPDDAISDEESPSNSTPPQKKARVNNQSQNGQVLRNTQNGAPYIENEKTTGREVTHKSKTQQTKSMDIDRVNEFLRTSHKPAVNNNKFQLHHHVNPTLVDETVLIDDSPEISINNKSEFTDSGRFSLSRHEETFSFENHSFDNKGLSKSNSTTQLENGHVIKFNLLNSTTGTSHNKLAISDLDSQNLSKSKSTAQLDNGHFIKLALAHPSVTPNTNPSTSNKKSIIQNDQNRNPMLEFNQQLTTKIDEYFVIPDTLNANNAQPYAVKSSIGFVPRIVVDDHDIEQDGIDLDDDEDPVQESAYQNKSPVTSTSQTQNILATKSSINYSPLVTQKSSSATQMSPNCDGATFYIDGLFQHNEESSSSQTTNNLEVPKRRGRPPKSASASAESSAQESDASPQQASCVLKETVKAKKTKQPSKLAQKSSAESESPLQQSSIETVKAKSKQPSKLAQKSHLPAARSSTPSTANDFESTSSNESDELPHLAPIVPKETAKAKKTKAPSKLAQHPNLQTATGFTASATHESDFLNQPTSSLSKETAKAKKTKPPSKLSQHASLPHTIEPTPCNITNDDNVSRNIHSVAPSRVMPDGKTAQRQYIYKK